MMYQLMDNCTNDHVTKVLINMHYFYPEQQHDQQYVQILFLIQFLLLIHNQLNMYLVVIQQQYNYMLFLCELNHKYKFDY